MSGQRVTRIDPQAGPESFKTYQIVAPRSTHFRPASCGEVDCLNYANGFQAVIDTSTMLGERQARYIENKSGRHFTSDGGEPVVTYTFPAGQRCFTEHQLPLEREPLFVVRDGDYRGNPRGTKPVHRRAEDWVDDFATHQQTLAERIEKG